MRRRILELAISAWFFIAWPALANADFSDYANANATRAAATTAASAATQSALIYGGAIVLAGVAIGVGLYLGLRNRK